VVPACGFDYIPGDLAAAIAAADLGGSVTNVGIHNEVQNMLKRRRVAFVDASAKRSNSRRPLLEVIRQQVWFRTLHAVFAGHGIL
jgi:short subunit dehydrogenase-like uncharacterized protein